MDYFLAIDQGTHASRALVVDDEGQVISHSQQKVLLSRPQPGRVEQDAEQILRSVETAVEEALGQLPADLRNHVRSCGITTQRSTVLAWDRRGTPLSAAINWQDTRGEGQLDALQSRAAEIRRISGLPLSAHYGASKLHCLVQAAGKSSGVRLGPLVSFLLDRLIEGGCYRVDHSNAQRMQLFDIRRLDWSAQLSEWFDVPGQALPECSPVLDNYGRLKTGGIPVTAVCGDQNAAWLGAAQHRDGTALVNLGSGAFILAPQPASATDPRLLTSIAWSNRDHCEYLIEGTVNGAGNALSWLREQRPLDDLDSNLSEWLQQVPEPPLFINTVGGLGSPWWQPGPEPHFIDNPDRYTTAQLAAGVAESVVFLICYNLQGIRKRQALQRIYASGGLSRVAPLCRKLANLSGLPVAVADDPEASARGVAWLAAGRPGNWQAPRTVQHFEPEADTALYNRYQLFIEQLEHVLDAREGR